MAQVAGTFSHSALDYSRYTRLCKPKAESIAGCQPKAMAHPRGFASPPPCPAEGHPKLGWVLACAPQRQSQAQRFDPKLQAEHFVALRPKLEGKALPDQAARRSNLPKGQHHPQGQSSQAANHPKQPGLRLAVPAVIIRSSSGGRLRGVPRSKRRLWFSCKSLNDINGQSTPSKLRGYSRHPQLM